MSGGDSRPAYGHLGLLAGARLVVNTSARFVYPFLPAIARGLGISLEQAGLLLSARWAVGMGVPAYVSLIGKGERLRRLMTVGLLLFAFGAAVTSATGVFLGALVGFVLLGIAKPLYDVAAQSYNAERSPYASRAKYLGMLELTWGRWTARRRPRRRLAHRPVRVGGAVLGPGCARWGPGRSDPMVHRSRPGPE